MTSEVVLESPFEVPEVADRQLLFAEVGGHSEIAIAGLAETRRRNAGHAFTDAGGILGDTVLVFAPNDGRGRAAAPAETAYFYTLQFPAAFSATSADSLDFGDSAGRLAVLSETGPSTLVFMSADDKITVSIVSVPALDPSVLDRADILLTNQFAGIAESGTVS